jgi:hypothetical protein
MNLDEYDGLPSGRLAVPGGEMFPRDKVAAGVTIPPTLCSPLLARNRSIY